MKLISIIKWEANKLAVALVYADASNDLTTQLGDLVLSAGSLAYTGDGSAYILNTNGWVKAGA